MLAPRFAENAHQRRLLVMLLPLGLMLGLAACHPGSVDDSAELDVVITYHDKSNNFGGYTSYAMIDSVFDYKDLYEGETEDWDGTYDSTILTAVQRNMEDNGYSRVEPDTTGGNLTWPQGEPSVIIIVGGVNGTGYLIRAFFPGMGYPWYGGYGWWMPWPIPTVQEFNTGTIIIDMLDFESLDPDQETFVEVWQGVLSGVVQGSATDANQRINSGIDQAYTQSPYLKVN